jgi:hypothetical protein
MKRYRPADIPATSGAGVYALYISDPHALQGIQVDPSGVLRGEIIGPRSANQTRSTEVVWPLGFVTREQNVRLGSVLTLPQQLPLRSVCHGVSTGFLSFVSQGDHGI